MRRAGWWILCAALWASATSAQPRIVDPTDPEEDDVDWGLALEQVDLGGVTLQLPTGMLRLGSRTFEEILVLEKHTGRVRRFAEGAALADALDLDVDTCGDRGLLAIAAHPFFDRGAETRPHPTEPERDWIYLSYHAGADGCSGGATTFRVARYVWNGAQLVSPVVVFEKALAADETTELGGGIAFGLDVDPDEEFTIIASLFIGIGALGHDGPLQNNRDVVPVDDTTLDDTGVMLRLRDDGTTPKGNPFDLVDNATGKEERYFAYGVRDPRYLAVDPPTQIFSTRVWASDRNDGGDDEVELLEFADNGGHSEYKGFQATVPPNLLRDGSANPAYKLVDLATGPGSNNTTIPVSTYNNPPFTFEAADVLPTGLAFGGAEAGLAHQQALFVGSEDGRVFRFAVRGPRDAFLLGTPLTDTVANLPIPDDPMTKENEAKPADDLAQIVIAVDFGAISDLETSVDGSLYVVDQENGEIHRIFSDAQRDLAIASIKVPKKIGLSDKKPVVTKPIQVTLLNQGEVAERILASTVDDPETPGVDEAVESLRANLEALLDVEISSDTGCAAPAMRIVVPKYALPPNTPAIGIAPNGGRLTLDVEVDWTCAAPSPKGTPDFATSASVDMQVLGILEADERLPDNVCPRPPDPDPEAEDPGCGAKTPTGLGGPIVTDVTRK
jgi:glucose/arabinose dehydrogenase